MHIEGVEEVCILLAVCTCWGEEIAEHLRAHIAVRVCDKSELPFLCFVDSFPQHLCSAYRVDKTAIGSRDRKGPRTHTIAKPPPTSWTAVQSGASTGLLYYLPQLAGIAVCFIQGRHRRHIIKNHHCHHSTPIGCHSTALLSE